MVSLSVLACRASVRPASGQGLLPSRRGELAHLDFGWLVSDGDILRVETSSSTSNHMRQPQATAKCD